jgi:hypothetical protein
LQGPLHSLNYYSGRKCPGMFAWQGLTQNGKTDLDPIAELGIAETIK